MKIDMQPDDTSSTLLPWSAVFILAVACVYLVLTRPGVLEQIQAQLHPTTAPQVSLSEQIREGSALAPELSPELSETLAKSKGFQALVSFTDAGFEPASLTVQAGDTVRFTNNSSENLWIRDANTSQTNADRATCESGSFDTCKMLKPQEFWEYTFIAESTWKYGNEFGRRTGVVFVK